jgi:predicted nucleic acid-binding protein
MELDTKTYWLTDRQSQCDFDLTLSSELLSEVERRVQRKKSSYESVVKNWVEFWTWQSKVIEKKWQEMNQSVQRRLYVRFEVTVGRL